MRSDSLNNLLKLRQWRKEEIETEISRLQCAIDDEERRLKTMESELTSSFEAFRNRQAEETLDPCALKTFHAYFSSMNTKLEQQKKAVLRKIAELEETKRLLIEAYKEKMLVENLKGRLCLRETRENNRREQKELDFIFTTRLKR